MAFRREVFSRALFDPNLGLWEGRDFLQRISTKPLIVDTKIRRCYPHTFKEYMREQMWYGRTILKYYRKVKFKKWPVEIIRSNAILGLISLSFLISPLSVLVASLLPIVATFIIVRRWLRKDVAFFGPQNIKEILNRFIWLLFRETFGRFCFDLGLLESIIKRGRVRIG